MKPGFKQSEVGVIPEDWEVPAIGSLGSVIRGASPRPKGDRRFYGGAIPRLMVEDVTRDKKFVTPRIDFLTTEGAKRSRPCKRGTLTVVCSGTPGVVGMPAFLAVDACIHDGMMALVNVSPKVVPDYLFHQLSSYQDKLYMAATHGGTFVNLTTAGLRAFRVALPSSEDEQRAIAEALSDVDALLGALDRLIAKKRDLKQAAMQQLLTGQKRLPGFHGEWKVKRLGDLGAFLKGSGVKKDESQSGTLSCIRYGEIYTRHNNYIKKFYSFISAEVAETARLLKEGDVLFAGSGETKEEIGKCVTFVDDIEAYAGGRHRDSSSARR